MPLTSDSRNLRLAGIFLLLVGYAIAIALTLSGKLPWHDEITTLSDSRQSFAHLVTTYYTHKGYILAAKISTSLLGESILALRLPAILMGAASLLAIYALGARLCRPSVGLASALYLLLHPSFLFYTTDARGYQGAFLFSTLTALFLWKGLYEARIVACVLAALSAFLGLMMHPTAALVYPGMAAAGLLLILRAWRDDSEGAETRRKRLLWVLALSGLAAAILIGPRIWDYFRWGTLLVPSRFVPVVEDGVGVGDGAITGPLRSLAGWKLYFAPLVVAEHHDGPIVVFGWLLMAVGLILGGRRFGLQGLLLALSLLAPFAFFVLYNPPAIVHRYLYAATPFAILLIVQGCFFLAERLSDWLFTSRRRWVRRVIEGALLASLFLACWGPFRAEIAFSEYGCTWMVPVSKLAQEEFMSETRFVLVDELPLWQEQLEMLGVPRENLDLYRPSEHSGYDPLLAGLDDRTWVVLKTHSQNPELQIGLNQLGRLELRIEQGLFFLPRADIASTTDTATEATLEDGKFMRTVRFLEQLGSLDFRFPYSVAMILLRRGFHSQAQPFFTQAFEGMARIHRWDYPRTFGAFTFPLGEEALRRGENSEAIRLYSRAFGKRESRVHDYIAFLDKVPPEALNPAVRSWRFSPKTFSRGFIEAMERGTGLEDDFKAYWSFRGTQVLDQNAHFAQALPLYEYSIRHGDSLGRSSQRLFQFHLKRGKPLEAAMGHLKVLGHPSTPSRIYLDLFDAIPEKNWPRVAALEGFDSKEYTEGLIAALRREESLTENEKAFWAGRVGKALGSLGFEEEARRLTEEFPAE